MWTFYVWLNNWTEQLNIKKLVCWTKSLKNKGEKKEKQNWTGLISPSLFLWTTKVTTFSPFWALKKNELNWKRNYWEVVGCVLWRILFFKIEAWLKYK